MKKFKFGRKYTPLIINVRWLSFDIEGRHLNTRYSVEAMNDIQMFHGIDAEAELTRILMEQFGDFHLDHNWVMKNILGVQRFKFGKRYQ